MKGLAQHSSPSRHKLNNIWNGYTGTTSDKAIRRNKAVGLQAETVMRMLRVSAASATICS